MSNAPIRCIGLSRWYGEVQGLSGLTADIGPGVVGLLGPNGSGKSTLMRLLTGQIKPSRGKVILFGQELTPGTWRPFSKIAYTPGDDIHFEDERAIDFLVLMARISGENSISARNRARCSLEQTGMEESCQKRLCEMSKGMRQRIKLAQALLFEPEVLLLDEPLNGMDPISRRATLDLIRELGQEGRTILLASHVLHDVESITKKILLLHHGRLLAEGALEDIRSLINTRPREVVVKTSAPLEVGASLMSNKLAAGMRFSELELVVETRQLDELLKHLGELGCQGLIKGIEIEDNNLESLFELLVGEPA
ncbi:MAG: ABC transporter ATP-binding protein [Planctomycetota bacterium]|jgi:ABC-2 type transport system ATP-binding protein|nr:ABC transporter ATP-binding protein [Planctomycetota bacterium]MDP6942325.1 ABC transporter ATP-binding protein [Planctomycetota bacterium]